MVHLTELPIEILEKISTYCDRESLDNLAGCYPIYKIIRESYFKGLKPYFGIIKYRWRVKRGDSH